MFLARPAEYIKSMRSGIDAKKGKQRKKESRDQAQAGREGREGRRVRSLLLPKARGKT